MMLILAGTKEEHLNMLEGGIIAKLLDEKWSTYAKVGEDALQRQMTSVPGFLHEAARYPHPAPHHGLHDGLPETDNRGVFLTPQSPSLTPPALAGEGTQGGDGGHHHGGRQQVAS